MHTIVDRAKEKVLVVLRYRHEVDRNDDRPFETLRLMNGNDIDAAALIVGRSFICREFSFPFGAEINGQLFEASNVIAARALEQNTDVAEGASLLIGTAAGDARDHAKQLERLGKQGVGRRSAPLAPQFLQAAHHMLCDRVAHMREVGVQIKKNVLTLLAQGISNIEQLSFGETNERSAENRSKSESITAVSQGTYQGHEVLGFLSSIEVLARLRSDWQSFVLKRAFVSPELGPPRSQQSDVTWFSPRDVAVGTADPHIPNQARAKVGDGLCFEVADRVDEGVRVYVVAQLCNALDPAQVVADGRLESSIATLLLHQPFSKDSIDMFKDAFPRAEVRGDLQNISWKLRLYRRACTQVRLEIGAAEAIDRLFGIPNHEQRSRTKFAAVP